MRTWRQARSRRCRSRVTARKGGAGRSGRAQHAEVAAGLARELRADVKGDARRARRKHVEVTVGPARAAASAGAAADTAGPSHALRPWQMIVGSALPVICWGGSDARTSRGRARRRTAGGTGARRSAPAARASSGAGCARRARRQGARPPAQRAVHQGRAAGRRGGAAGAQARGRARARARARAQQREAVRADAVHGLARRRRHRRALRVQHRARQLQQVACAPRRPLRAQARRALARQHPAGGLAVCEGRQQAALLLQLTLGASDSLRVAAYAPQGARSVGESSARTPPGFPSLSRLFTDAAGSRPYGTLTHGSNKLLVVGEDALMSNTGALSLASFCARSGSVMQVQLGVCEHDDTPLSAPRPIDTHQVSSGRRRSQRGPSKQAHIAGSGLGSLGRAALPHVGSECRS